MKKRLLVTAVLLAARVASAEPVPVKVIEVAGDAAYVSPGRAAGVIAGATVHINGHDYKVVEATEQTAVVKVGGDPLHVGDGGTADATPGATSSTRQLAKPRPPEAFAGQWPDAVLPASRQNPAPVSLGSGKAPTQSHVTILGKAYGGVDKKSHDGELEGRVIASFDLVEDRPLAADLDVAGRLFLAGFDSGTHTPLMVRAAQLRYGSANDPRLALGRLRYAASAIGMLDGGRAAMKTGSFEVAAFGGLVPDPLGGKPDTGAARFGGEAIYDAADTAWQPRVAVTAYGSTWQGALDERRLAIVSSASQEALRFDGWAELQSFPSNNEFDAKSLEVTGAGTTAQWRKRGRHLGLDITFLRPERSRRLAAALPLEWLCTPVRVPNDSATTCGGGSSWTTANASAGWGGARWNVDGIGSLTRTQGIYSGVESSGYLRGEVRFGPGRAEAAVSGGKASFGAWTAGEIGAGYAATNRFDVGARYRPELLDYVASTGPMLLHSVIGDVRYATSPAFDISVSAIGTTGEDRKALAVLALVAWRPLP
ncbi:MAG TPA: hypothetical protein VLB44_01675 [Kofleriaceae bacterium]|nr:hypothetical protein [Kofleriaceae bacterium]